MTLGTDPAPLTRDQDKNLDAACTSVTSEIARTDSKASLLLAFDGAVLAGLASVADKDLPPSAKAVGGLAVLALAAAAVLLLLVVRPNLGGGRIIREGLPHWARLAESELKVAMADDVRPARVKALSVLAVGKFQRLARAVDVILAALALLLAAAVLAVTG